MAGKNEITITKVYVLYVKNSCDNPDVPWVRLFSSLKKSEVKKRFALHANAKIEEYTEVVAKTRKTILSK